MRKCHIFILYDIWNQFGINPDARRPQIRPRVGKRASTCRPTTKYKSHGYCETSNLIFNIFCEPSEPAEPLVPYFRTLSFVVKQ